MWGATSMIGRTTSAFAFIASRTAQQSCHHHNCYYSTTTALAAKTQFLLKYNYIPDVLEKRGPYREGHLGLAKELIAEGKCLSGGPTGEVNEEVPTGALFIFTDLDAAEQFVEKDPYVSGGIVTAHSIEQWTVVVEKEA